MLRWLICKETEGTSQTTHQRSFNMRALDTKLPSQDREPPHAQVPNGMLYLHDVFFFHPRWKRETLAEDLEQHGPESVVVIPLHWPNTFNVVPPEQLLIGLAGGKGGRNELRRMGRQCELGEHRFSAHPGSEVSVSVFPQGMAPK